MLFLHTYIIQYSSTQYTNKKTGLAERAGALAPTPPFTMEDLLRNLPDGIDPSMLMEVMKDPAAMKEMMATMAAMPSSTHNCESYQPWRRCQAQR